MIKAFLIDLDGTLLDIDMSYFIPYYLRRMGEQAQTAGLGDGEEFVRRLLEATDAMRNDLNPEFTNEDIFKQDFFRDDKYEIKAALTFFERFYNEEFPKLSVYCRPFAAARSIVEKIFTFGVPVVIATNAVFPVAAIEERLRWGKVADFPYTFITHFSNMHFCKPNTEYYLEIAAKLGVAPEECLMIGNDVDEDLVAGTIGMKTFLLEEFVLDRKNSGFVPDYKGKFADLAQFLEKLS